MKFRNTIFVFLMAVSPLACHAGEEEEGLINDVVEAYGGDTLLNMRSFRIEDQFVGPTFGQGWAPDLDEISRTRQILNVDIENKKTSFETWNEGRGGTSQNATIVNGDAAHSINYTAMTYGEATSADAYTFAGGAMRMADTLLAYELNKVRDTVKYLGDENYMNRPHIKLSMPFPQSPELILYIDRQSHLISRMVRNNPQFGDLDYVFDGHQSKGGVVHASRSNFFIGGQANIISTKHEFDFNLKIPDETFELAADLKPEAERIDASTMVVNKISDRVYHLGQNGGFSIFVNTSDGIVAAGGYPALQARFDRFQEESETYKALRYQIVTHHHSDHVAGLGEAVALGARLVTIQDNVQPIKDLVPTELQDWHFLPIGTRTTFGDGANRVEIYEVTTTHAKSFLVTYVAREKLVFIADHLGSPYKTGIPVANINTVDMLGALQTLDIDIKKIATAHNARIFTWKEMVQSVAAYTPVYCANNRPVCL